MSYLEIVKKRLCEKELTPPIAKRGEMVFETASRRISSVLNVIEVRKRLSGGSVVDGSLESQRHCYVSTPRTNQSTHQP